MTRKTADRLDVGSRARLRPDPAGRIDAADSWNSPFYGIEGRGWFLNFHCFTSYVKVVFFHGASLRPVPPGASKQENVRYLDIHEHDRLDEARLAAWVDQASRLPDWGTV